MSITEPDKTGIHDVLEKLGRVFMQYLDIDKVVLFGSRARGDHRRTSDIDLCIYGNDLSKRDRYDILDAIEDIETFYSFDIVFYDELDNEAIKESIIKDMYLIYERNNYG